MSKPTKSRTKSSTRRQALALAPLPAEPLAETGPAVVEHEAIARLAYSYWEARGSQGGSAEADWTRAERELQPK